MKCQACWAFAATGALEGAYFIKTGQLVSFSEQQLVDCNKECLDGQCQMGCKGGEMWIAFFHMQFHAMMTEAEYPYIADTSVCREGEGLGVTKIQTWGDVEANSIT